ncbi:MAG: DegT/DnrJ/EryC1/StrS family aminotransferase [Rhodobacteraceae bacterium]|nr:DegT/DnrJ/EryC1/StrS family aminotransferase [Paracoccaceae bacterium]
MSDDFIMQMRPLFGAEEKAALAAYMDEDGFLTEFRKTAAFEEAIAAFTGAKHCIVTNNGTISLTLAAMALGITAGDEVIVPNYTMIASPNSVAMFGAKPVFADVEAETLCMDIAAAGAAITPKTRALMLVAANGRAPKAGIKAFQDLCARHDLVLIEDAAQALGSRYDDGTHIGLKGAVGSFSFSMPKIISTGQGGALITNDDTVAARLRRLKDFGRAGGGTDVHDSIGYNFKFTEMQAVIGLEQLKKLPERVVRKRDLYRRYAEGLNGVDGVALFAQDLDQTVPWFYDVLAEDRAGLMAHLKEAGIGTRVMYPPINRQAAYRVPGVHPVSDMIGDKGLWLPSMVQLSDDQVDRITAALRKFYGAS